MTIDGIVWPVVTGTLGVMLKSAWDSYLGWRDKLRVETWKIRTTQLEERLSKFYWPLYIRLLRDDNVWEKVFYDLSSKGSHERPGWATELKEEQRTALRVELEKGMLIPNHVEAVQIITSSMHLSDDDEKFRAILLKYVRHVDVYRSLRSAGLTNVEPIDVKEEFPHGLSGMVGAKLREYQEEYDKLLRERPIAALVPRGKRSRGRMPTSAR